MTIERSLTGIASSGAVYVEDVFSTYLYNGTGASQTITNGINLAGKGGLVWMKSRSAATSHTLYDTARGATFEFQSDVILGQATQTAGLTAFGTTGFTIGNYSGLNTNAATYASWTFRKAPKFFDIVSYTGDGAATRDIAHNLGCVPGMIIIMCQETGFGHLVYHKSLGVNSYLLLSGAGAATTSAGVFRSVTSSTFGVDSRNNAGNHFIAYLFADSSSGGFGASGTDSIVACGSFTTSGGAATVSLGWEPQYFMIKRTDGIGDWWIFDSMRGMPASPMTTPMYLFAESTSVEGSSGTVVGPTANGITLSGWTPTATFIYLAIRRGPMKTPTDATKVFAPVKSSAATGTAVSVGFPIDTQIIAYSGIDSANSNFNDRLRGVSTTSTASGNYLVTSATAAEASTTARTQAWDNANFSIVSFYAGANTAYWNFRRAPGFFDVVCYTGTGSATTVAHNLSVAPELIIAKSRSGIRNWICYHSALGNTSYIRLNQTAGSGTVDAWNSTTPTASVFSLGTYVESNASAEPFVAYLFASLAGVSKVGSYTGNGSTQTINCGFSAGARFVLIKRTDATGGDWYVWDTARGIVAANDPHISLNTSAAEVTTDDSIDPDNSGFIVNQVAATNINVTSAPYIYLAIA